MQAGTCWAAEAAVLLAALGVACVRSVRVPPQRFQDCRRGRGAHGHAQHLRQIVGPMAGACTGFKSRACVWLASSAR
eukprot:1139902-Pelagomonas_calceolata.AAC.7